MWVLSRTVNTYCPHFSSLAKAPAVVPGTHCVKLEDKGVLVRAGPFPFSTRFIYNVLLIFHWYTVSFLHPIFNSVPTGVKNTEQAHKSSHDITASTVFKKQMYRCQPAFMYGTITCRKRVWTLTLVLFCVKTFRWPFLFTLDILLWATASQTKSSLSINTCLRNKLNLPATLHQTRRESRFSCDSSFWITNTLVHLQAKSPEEHSVQLYVLQLREKMDAINITSNFRDSLMKRFIETN